MSSTRLLILGAVRIFQPAHGYFVRRELLSWRADEWTSLNPGSIYHALRTLTRDGFLEEAGRDAAGGPARTAYRLTDDGEKEFFQLLRAALWSTTDRGPETLMTALAFAPALKREEIAAAMRQRIAVLEGAGEGIGYKLEAIAGDRMTPPHVAEIVRLGDAVRDGALRWARAFLERVEAGDYVFAGEPWPDGHFGLTEPTLAR